MSAILRSLSFVRTICSRPVNLHIYPARTDMCNNCHLLQCWARGLTSCSRGIDLKAGKILQNRLLSTSTRRCQESKHFNEIYEGHVTQGKNKMQKGKGKQTDKEKTTSKNKQSKATSVYAKLQEKNKTNVKKGKQKNVHKATNSILPHAESDKKTQQEIVLKAKNQGKSKQKVVPKDNIKRIFKVENNKDSAKKKSKQKNKHKKLSPKRREELLRRVTLDEFGPLTEFDFSEESITDVEPNEQIVEELEQLLRDEHLSQEVSDTLQRVLLDYKSVLEGGDTKRRATFWKPEQLDNMSEIQQALKELCVWQRLHTQKKVNTTVIETINAERRMQSYQKRLVPYIDACISANMVSAAHSIVLGPYHFEQSGVPQIRDVNLYETVMQAWAKQGQFEQIRELAKAMAAQNLDPTLKSYAAVLEVFGRQHNCDQKIVQAVMIEGEKKGFDLRVIPHVCNLSDESKEFVEKAVKLVKPDFAFSAPRAPRGYECSLVKHLNSTGRLNNYSPQLMENAHANAVTGEELLKGLHEQMMIETQERIAVEPIMQMGNHSQKMRQLHGKLMSKWRTDLTKAFQTELLHQKVLFNKLGKIPRYEPYMYPFLKMLPEETYIDFMMEELKSVPQMMTSFNYPLMSLVYGLGEKIFTYYEKSKLFKSDYMKRLENVYGDYLRLYNEETPVSVNHRVLFQEALARNDLESLHCSSNYGGQVPSKIIKMMGMFLYDLLLSHAKINSNILRPEKYWNEGVDIPIWFTTTNTIKDKNHHRQRTVLQLHPFMKKLVSSTSGELSFPANIFPTVAPPLPWTDVQCGGYLLPAGKECNLVRQTSDSDAQEELMQRTPKHQLYPVIDSLNALAATPWKINEPILDLIIEVFKSGGNKELDVPMPMSSLPEPPTYSGGITLEQYRERALSKQRRHEAHGLWMGELYRLSIANKFRKKTFWFPHNLDFRGRVYAIPPHFNHLGNDLARSIMIFAKAKPLGENGLDWMKIHLVNLTGMKKRSSNADRLQFANEMMPQILDSADKPFEGEKWWQNSDEPWQTLAVCKEIANAVRSPDPTQYLSNLPVHQDGSCNGLQHYAALGRDASGAESVNLAPNDVPKDVYSDIVVLVEQERQKDAEGNGKDAAIAKILEGFIERKVIKQTIMTTVYGVTRFGGKLQIERQLEKLKDFPQEHVFDAAWYLVHKTFYCLHQKFSATKEIQHWLTVCAQVISRLSMQQVHWVTPLGLPVLQPYQQTVTVLKELPKKRHIIDDAASEEEWLQSMNEMKKARYSRVHYGKPNTMKQRNAFPPNFIHSLDSTHMMLTAMHCLRHGVTFASVHDCFWTHASDVETMNKICREQFIQLHNQPILEELSEYMYRSFGCHSDNRTTEDLHPVVKNFVNHVLKRVPPRGDFQIESVQESPYFFS